MTEIFDTITTFMAGLTSVIGAASILAAALPQVGIIGEAIHTLAFNFGHAENEVKDR
jgi:C4-dicarboxylate transporter